MSHSYDSQWDFIAEDLAELLIKDRISCDIRDNTIKNGFILRMAVKSRKAAEVIEAQTKKL